MLGCVPDHRTFEDSRIFSSHRNLQNLFFIQGLCEDICQLLFSVDVNDVNIFLHDMIFEKVMTNFNVLCLRVLNWVVSNLDGAFVVAVKWHLLQMNAIVLECLLHPRSRAQQDPAAMYSDSAVERDTQFCFFEDQHTSDRPRK